MKNYGKELILDLHECDPTTFTRESIEKFFITLCDDIIFMERDTLFFWDDVGLPPEECQTSPHLKGTSAVQFIVTSNITIHTLDLMGRVYLNVFSCKDFNPNAVEFWSMNWFRCKKLAQKLVIDRV